MVHIYVLIDYIIRLLFNSRLSKNFGVSYVTHGFLTARVNLHHISLLHGHHFFASWVEGLAWAGM